MKLNRVLLLIALSLLWLVGCSDQDIEEHTSEKPDAAEILELDSNADIFQRGDSIYQTGIDWVDELKLVEKEHVGEIEFKASKPEEFKNGAANKLPIGAEIYSVKDHDNILIVKFENEVKRYLASSEG
ncbi:hypothetical protein MKZ08_10225 [Viridibacillus sp. FSL R5-0477]|uniref:Lipoprotein n=1 Tax=Viridibacillus arenosi FSL R5-213 TaxID=1227360 RepID=W4F2W3_9BACL|nr:MULTISPECIES: hypothetical protein [Viridibacillus]ETT86637.1 hypothetical protein C176_07982 [Viridibacillus arenosi FSL R5-213]OMC83542.1 hypothetical protein BK130_08405 [Viridibacillus sp. FSL H8-0123]OMC84527.1 hypothetical protein BK128_16705 [Viridibacillus sp. FSL H7-0596]OMC89588.1 hypothetical protein BK137_17735 [Viridibacillus arenosi]